jgi:DNA-binding MarR family transcriptional regulator
MSIEHDIQQSRFRNPAVKSMVNLLFTVNWLEMQVKAFLQTENITTQQYNILRILRGSNKPMSTLEIRGRMLDRMSDTSRIVDRMLLKEWILKCTDPQDKRKVSITITPKGLELLARLDARNAELDGVMKGLTDTELDQLNRLLDKLRG